jgi:hypothetical protein
MSGTRRIGHNASPAATVRVLADFIFKFRFRVQLQPLSLPPCPALSADGSLWAGDALYFKFLYFRFRNKLGFVNYFTFISNTQLFAFLFGLFYLVCWAYLIRKYILFL